ncbi:RNA-dependent RNA polymerase [Ophiocordyceps sinensis ormycovirus 1]
MTMYSHLHSSTPTVEEYLSAHMARKITNRDRKDLRTRNHRSFIGGQVVTQILSKEHSDHMGPFLKNLRGLSFRSMRNFKLKLMLEYECKVCIPHILIGVGYIKFHCEQYPETCNMGLHLIHDHFTLEGLESYSEYPEIRSHIYETKVLEKKELPEELANNCCYKAELASIHIRTGVKMLTRNLPSPNAFPDYDLGKESKMWLCNEPTPTENQVTLMKSRIRELVKKYGPTHLNIPHPKCCESFSPSFYSDGLTQKRDYEKPQYTWSASWAYQTFKTNATTNREVWLPPKAYKMVSTYWHYLTEPILERVPFVTCNDTFTDMRKNVFKRWKPCRKIDLKGCGLQYPREYIIAAMEVMYEIYEDPVILDFMTSAKKMFSKLNIRMPDGSYVWPLRGVGLGYFNNLMALVTAAAVSECEIIQMFNDDILCPKQHYDLAISNLTNLGFIINEKKTGATWNKVAYFAGSCMTAKGSLKFFEVQGEVAGIFRKRYHFERKNQLCSIFLPRRLKACYVYERLFGHEYEKGESFNHPNMMGINTHAPDIVGFVKGGELRKYLVPPTEGSEEMRRLWSITCPWKEPKDKKSFALIRKGLKKKYNAFYDTEMHEYLNPKIEGPDEFILEKPDFHLGKYQLPRWADMQMILSANRTCGRTVHMKHPAYVANKMVKCMLSRDPIGAALSGGYDIISPFHRVEDVPPFYQLLYDSLKRTVHDSWSFASKRTGDNSSFTHDEEKTDFLAIMNTIEENSKAQGDGSEFFDFEALGLKVEINDDLSLFDEDDRSEIDIFNIDNVDYDDNLDIDITGSCSQSNDDSEEDRDSTPDEW